MNRTYVVGTAALGVVMLAQAERAHAQLWDAVEGKAKPHMIVGFDTSVTMGITSNCSGCHSPTRLDEAKDEITATLPIFRNYFYYGGYRYRGCGSARYLDVRRPDRTDPAGSLANTLGLINAAGHCGSSENHLPGGAGTSGITPGSRDDERELLDLLAPTNGLNGLRIPRPSAPFPLTPPCDATGVPLDLRLLLQAEFASTNWPRFNVAIDSTQVEAQLCTPLRTGLGRVYAQVETCLGAADAATYWNFAGFDCNAATIATNVCNGSTLEDTCVCDQTIPGCTTGSGASPICSTELFYKARQQVGICGSYMPDTFGNFFEADADNIFHRGTNPNACRENVALFFTDGHAGGSRGVLPEATLALSKYYRSPTLDAGGRAQSNMFLFHISNFFHGEADAMASALENPRYNATNQTQMFTSFSRIVNRVYRGSYVGANMTTDRFGTRLAVHSFEVPSGPGLTGEEYLGRPSRVAVYEIGADGTPSASPLYATDWASKIVSSRTLCVGAPTGGCALSALERNRFGALAPNTSPFRNGVQRRQNVAAYPGESEARRWGYMLGGSGTQPIFVDAPRDLPAVSAGTAFESLATAAANRPRMIYVMSNAFLHGIHAGARTNSPPALGTFGVQRAYDYDDADAASDAGEEVFRYFPRTWLRNNAADGRVLNPDYNVSYNDLVPQSLITGQLQARDLQIVPGTFRTILAAAQGRNGRGLATLDVTDPMGAPTLLDEWYLPAGSTASAEPQLHQWSVNGAARGALVTTSGLGGGRSLYAFDVRNGNVLGSLALGGSELATEPACLDATGRGSISHCYLLARGGELWRIPVNVDGTFGAAVDVAPAEVRGAGRQYLTRPIVFFGHDGSVNIAFGSGNSLNFAPGSDTAQNRFFKVVDAFNKSSSPISRGTVASVCNFGGSLQDGVIELGDYRVVSPPVISKGVVAFTAYRPGNSGCETGTGVAYAFDFATCADAYAVSPTVAPRAHGIVGDGIPTSPVIIRGAQAILTQGSDHAAGNVRATAGLRTRGGDRVPFRKLYWRPKVQAQ